ncbi:hypothetical protein [Rubinisphaera italica]|uniref:Uncharacterized protein n=1 Tax=Rubinisphaera italica TaxID=2527969 RepID=A0A5C5XJ69_9PLAN|nr:hypothetical protein [Rubinisphaera italica]TWT62401.1 hypothetical protein Pan54_31430 [Rubinisphaera italica]HBN77886.1 hypothetical protein [Planctomycetaceae bacterium]|tara:strand:+ start:425 stop:775 length:351 start_codon:yes stop_codon:yes gene_type:complete
MTLANNYLSDLDSWLPDELVIEDVRRFIEIEAKGKLEMDSGLLVIPAGIVYEVVSKALIKQEPNIGFGSCFRAVVAVGGSTKQSSGILKALFVFVTFWYTISGKLITMDYAEETPL